ncbi:MAG TPA: hypothetical protein VK171_03565 [Fimbriimonas sp.]|nr:hypothetical protein [Fimbriimonas sp.]
MSTQISPVFFKGISMVTATPDVALGTLREESGEIYRYVYNCGIAATGTGVGLIRPASAAAGLYSVSVSSVSGDACLGFVKHVSIPASEYGWALINGLVTIAIASGASTVAAGCLGLGANGACATHTAGMPVGQITTQIVSGNSGALRVQLP